MRKLLIGVAVLLISCGPKIMVTKNSASSWDDFEYPEVNFVNNAEGTRGWEIYNRIIPSKAA